MALYDNQHWLLSHIRDSFVATDDTGLCEVVMLGDDIPKALKQNGSVHCYPGNDDNDDEDLNMAESYEIQMDMPFSHRPRSNTAQRLEKMEKEKKIASKTRHVKWERNMTDLTEEERMWLFKKKDVSRNIADVTAGLPKSSVLTEQLLKSPYLPQNPFKEYAKFDGSVQFGVGVRKFRIFMWMLPPEERSYPTVVSVIATAKVREFIGLICFKHANENPNHNLGTDETKYGLYLMEDDGDIVYDFSCLDPSAPISKFEFASLALTEMSKPDMALYCNKQVAIKSTRETKDEVEKTDSKDRDTMKEDMAKMEGHAVAMEAPMYQLYRVHIVNKVRAKTEIHLGISGEKIEIDPVITGKGAGRFWNRQRAVSYHIDNIAWCELTENKGSKTIFTLVYTMHTSLTLNSLNISSSQQPHSLHQSMSFKNHDFEADSTTAEEIVRKVNHILQLRSSLSRKEYLAHRERKAARRKSFHLHR